jgi:hypothetical protein
MSVAHFGRPFPNRRKPERQAQSGVDRNSPIRRGSWSAGNVAEAQTISRRFVGRRDDICICVIASMKSASPAPLDLAFAPFNPPLMRT